MHRDILQGERERVCVCRSTAAAEAVLASNGWNECGCWLPEDDSNGSMAGGPGGSLASPSCVGCRLTLATRVVHDLDGVGCRRLDPAVHVNPVPPWET